MEEGLGKNIMFLNYYGVDWLIFLLVITHLWLLGNKKRVAFLFGMAGNTFGIMLGFLVDSVACIIMNMTFVFMHLNAFRKWGSK